MGRTAAKTNDRKSKTRKRGRRGRGATSLAAEAASCSSPGPSSNLNGCNFNDEDFVGIDLSSSNMRNVRFRGAELCGADLSSSQLKDADFRGLSGANRTNLMRANLSSSGCAGTKFDANTVFCQTKTCNGTVNNRDCPVGVAATKICCVDADCRRGFTCAGNVCVTDCDVCLDGCTYDSLADAAADPDGPTTIRICPDTYHTVNVLIDRNLTVIGEGAAAADTVLDAEEDGRVVRIAAGVEVVLQNLQVTGGLATGLGGGILNQGKLRLIGVTVTGNTVFFGDNSIGAGGGILNSHTNPALPNATLTLEDGSRVTGNTAEFGGGIFNNGSLVTNPVLTLKSGSSVDDNTANTTAGGIYATGTVTLEAGSRVTENRAGQVAGGVFNDGGTVSIADADIVTNNTVGGNINNCQPALTNCPTS